MEPWEYAEIDYMQRDVERCEACGSAADLYRGFCGACILVAAGEIADYMDDWSYGDLESACDAVSRRENNPKRKGLYDVAADFIAHNFELED